ncbi:PA14 domain-containing protein [Jiulongibacter sp. NS-SX5]|uniref:PA14 domain-containing protein n=1 Tax=Jiulongibacter sp. NS-SX5 TaxID=3463854 RepID=UPI004058B905
MKRILLAILFLSSAVNLYGQSCVGESGYVHWNIWMNFGFEPDSSDMSIMDVYPEYPDQQNVLGSLQTPRRFNNYYASLIRGYISVPATDDYYFNVVGDDDTRFYLSSDESRDNLDLIARVYNYAAYENHYDTTIQTSQLIRLTAGQNYYFELHHFEGSGDDHATVYWRAPNSPDTDTVWQVIDHNYIKAYDCQGNCAPKGTACNDGNSATTNDQEDGFCNCVGEYPKTTACIGEREKVDAYYFDNIDGSYVEYDLLNAPNFPLVPDRQETLEGAYGPLETYVNDNYGTLVQGYLTVPVTGVYNFNITGDNQTFFYLSSDDNIANKQSHQALVYHNSGEVEHDRSSFQNIGPLTLEAGQFYYYEFRHKESGWRDFFSLHWKTPWQNTWKLVPKFYLYDYDCELSCVAEGTPCDDGNIYTNNDQYDANCNCVGTPCSGSDCDDTMAKYSFYEPAGSTGKNMTTAANSWETCGSSLATNPNPARASQQRWIMYDFDQKYRFQGSRVWNYNVSGQTDKGFRQVYVDYSEDGVSWTALGGLYNWPQAPGILDYGGFVGPNFNDVKARYILISAANNHGDPLCYGFSDISIDAIHCDDKDTPCDDLDPLTSYDKFDDNCNCKGVDIKCASDTILLARETLADPEFEARMHIESRALVPSTENISFTAGNSIVLLPGFEVDNSGVFRAEISDCLQAAFVANQEASKKRDEEGSSMITSVEERHRKEVIFRLNEPDMVALKLKDAKGNTLVTIIEDELEILGTYTKYIPTNRLRRGTYTVELTINDNLITETFEVN